MYPCVRADLYNIIEWIKTYKTIIKGLKRDSKVKIRSWRSKRSNLKIGWKCPETCGESIFHPKNWFKVILTAFYCLFIVDCSGLKKFSTSIWKNLSPRAFYYWKWLSAEIMVWSGFFNEISILHMFQTICSIFKNLTFFTFPT